MANGIKIDRDSFKMVVPAFVMWMDRTYPNLSGALAIKQTAEGVKFEYRSFDGQHLSDQDKAIIRRKWETCMKEAHEKQQEAESIPNLAAQAIASIQGGYYGDAIVQLVDLMQQSRCTCSQSEEF